MSAEANRIVQKLWSYCTVLRDDGLSYGDDLEQLSVMLFLKLAHEQTQTPWNQDSPVPEGYDWSTLVGIDGVQLETQYYKPGAIEQRQPTWSEATPEGRWRSYPLEDLLARNKISLDLFWLKDESLLDSDNLPEPDVIAAEIAEDLRSVLEQMEEILGDLEPSPPG